ncbi:hypothetical protein XMM379_000077 [Aliiroseovarius sp. xm-m-379]|nr:hypothetical protein [Aliiroseovarius sp. xm-m-379]NRP32205.1 hypothetical protein [Aliiroseovarius sp. xm-a-104]NRP44072.1 hypothetical protein [Aliiroseovarius sp. xm-m-378]NRP48626.1 hypothetical protein [Aliiroseovarius sp. xm-m-354]NRP64943.1 hypothetical protein [Aliiroseovarius sp. xm-v-225]NRP91892.1 hypothetical protein [Aliiroseovarius sp. xm-a-134]NRQ03379.1 hypothetical protein [Aliiroseovarius sp. xm-m-309]NRQ06584.1 hypothetical protein [Aliiroseovarius sp. xm-v-201]NRQ1932
MRRVLKRDLYTVRLCGEVAVFRFGMVDRPFQEG